MTADLPWLPVAVGADRFEHDRVTSDEPRLYGGLVAAQLLAAAACTVEAPCHSMHVQFAAPGSPAKPVCTRVERLRDGRSFSGRAVRASQEGQLISYALLSFAEPGHGPEHQVSMPDAPDPEDLEDQREIRRRNAAAAGRAAKDVLAERIVDARPIEMPVLTGSGGTHARRLLWLRSRAPLPDTVADHQAMLAFASDMGLVHVAMAAHNALGEGLRLDAASLDHSVWFHTAFRADEWLLHSQTAEMTANGRGLTRGAIFTRDGVHVASTAQEVLIRYQRDDRSA